jgi:hypothetical protein
MSKKKNRKLQIISCIYVSQLSQHETYVFILYGKVI